jgi:PAS domain S-box-containing protein
MERIHVPGKRFGAFVAEADVPVFNSFLQRVFAGPGKHACELTLRRDPQPSLIVKMVASLSADGQECRAVVSDISERKRTEEALKLATEHFRRFVDANIVGILVATPDGAVREANDYYLRLIGHTREELAQGQVDWRALTSPEWLPADEKAIRELRERGTCTPYEKEYVRRDGTRVPVFLADAMLPGPGEEIAAFALDLTERKLAEAALRESSQFNRLIIDGAHEGIIVYGTDQRYQVWNPFMEALVGLKASEVLGKLPLEVFPSLKETGLLERLAVALSGQIPDPVELQFNVQGKDLWSINTCAPLRNAAGQIIGAIATVQDITGRKRAEMEKERLEAQNRQLQKAESLGRMAGAIAHHFNNQLQALMMDLDFAMHSQGKVAEETLAEAMQAARKAAEVSSLMLTYLGQAQGKPKPINLCTTCLRSLSLLRALVPHGMTLESDLAAPGPVINADLNQIQQLLTNLVTNAWEASKDRQGSIHLRVSTAGPSEISGAHRFPIDWRSQAQSFACLEVADHGCGIAEGDIEKIFDPFFSSKFTGRGMGLSAVLGIVHAHQGVITVESKPGHGSVFRVFLPTSGETLPQTPKPATQARDFATGLTVLLVDDEPAVREAVTRGLKRLGFTVLAAENGAKAVALFQEHAQQISLVLCDLTMPGMNGWETLAALRKLAPGLPAILSSGYNEAQTMEGQHPEQPQAFLGKPYPIKDLRDTIVRVLEMAHDAKQMGGIRDAFS